MKDRWTFARVAALAAVLLACAQAAPPARADVVAPWVKTSGTRFVDSSGSPVTLRGVDLNPHAGVAGVAAVGANVVRLAVTWDKVEPSAPVDGVHAWSQTELGAIDNIVSGLQQRGIDVIVDFHQCGWSAYWPVTGGCGNGIPAWYYADGRFPTTAAGKTAAKKAWWTSEADRSHAAYIPFVEMMVQRYSAYPNVLGYEIFNEPQGGGLGQSTFATNTMLGWQVAVRDAIRAIDPTRAIFFQCRGGGEGIGTADLSQFGSLAHMVLDFHDYFAGVPGTGLDAAGDDWTPSQGATHTQTTFPYTGTLDAQEAVLQVPLQKAAAAGIPLFVGEWGARFDDANLAEYQRQLFQLLDGHHLAWTRWSLSSTDSLRLRNADGSLNEAGLQLKTYLTTGTLPQPADQAPANTALPAITGTASVGATLQASRGTWDGFPTDFAFAWSRCDASGCVEIAGATAPSYTATAADVGATLVVTVTASNSAGSASATSAPSDPVASSAAPVSTALPDITGTPAVGTALQASTGTWDNEPTDFAFAWSRCASAGCTAIPGATLDTYVPVPDDVGFRLRVTVTATNAAGSRSADSLQTTAVTQDAPVNVTPPTIGGTPAVGATLTASRGTWSGSPTGFAFQWLRCTATAGCNEIAGATANKYVVVAADAGAAFEVSVTAANAGGRSAPATSAPTARVPSPVPVNTTPPSIAGTAAVGSTLTASPGAWSGSPTGFAFQWLRCTASASCTDIAGATAARYVVAPGDVGASLEVQVTATNAGGTSDPATSAPTLAVPAPAPVSTAPPSITGTPRVGRKLTASPGSWLFSPSSFAYRWSRCTAAGCTQIKGATGKAYTPVKADVGDTLVVAVTAKNAAGSTTASSARFGPVKR